MQFDLIRAGLILVGVQLLSTVSGAPVESDGSSQDGNLQKFKGNIGSPAPAVTLGGRGFLVALLKGPPAEYTDLAGALSRSCDVQKNLCANFVNGGKADKGDKKLSVADCESQYSDCIKFPTNPSRSNTDQAVPVLNNPKKFIANGTKLVEAVKTEPPSVASTNTTSTSSDTTARSTNITSAVTAVKNVAATDTTTHPTNITTPLKDTTDPPKETTDLSKKTTDPPKETTDPLKDAAAPPADTTTPPKETTDLSKKTTDPPKETTDPLKDAAAPPADTATPPKETTDPPKETTDPPKETTDSPKGTTDPPKETTDPSKETPKETTDPSKETPKETTDLPKETTDPPKETTDPLKDAAAPPADTITPSKNITTPSTDTTNSPANVTTPSTDKATPPPVDKSTPPKDTATPSKDKTPPANTTTTSAASQTSEGNLQTFIGALGNIPAPKVVKNGNKFDVLKAKGGKATLNALKSAIVRSCDVQFNACADAFNLNKTPGTSLEACGKQKTDCLATVDESVKKAGDTTASSTNNSGTPSTPSITPPTTTTPPTNTTTPSPSTTPPAIQSTEGNLQTFTGALGGISPPKVVKGEKKFDVIKADGSKATLSTLKNALVRSCDIQFNKCADAFNLKKTPGTSLDACGKQKTDCIASTDESVKKAEDTTSLSTSTPSTPATNPPAETATTAATNATTSLTSTTASPINTTTSPTNATASPTDKNPAQSASTGGNLQTFTGALGGISPPQVVKGDKTFDVIKKDGSKANLNKLKDALVRSCDAQFNACADAFNLKKTPGTSLEACGKQKNDCTATVDESVKKAGDVKA